MPMPIPQAISDAMRTTIATRTSAVAARATTTLVLLMLRCGLCLGCFLGGGEVGFPTPRKQIEAFLFLQAHLAFSLVELLLHKCIGT